MRPKRRRLVPWLVAAVVLALLGWALAPRPVPVDVAEVVRGPLEVRLAEEGETRVRERFVISSPLAGRVLRIDLEPGDPVLAGKTVLATFEPASPILLDARGKAQAEARIRATQAAVGQARAELERAAAEAAYWAAERERVASLAGQGIVAQDQLDAAELDLATRRDAERAAAFAVRTAEHELEAARAALLESGTGGKAIEIRSPVDGFVLRRLRESEAVVPAGEPLLEIGDPEDLEVIADYLSRDAVRIRPGQPVVIEQWGGDRPLTGKVRRVEPAGFLKISALGVEEQRVNVLIDLVEPASERLSLGDSFRVEVEVVVWNEDDVLKVPTSSLFRDGASWAVFTLEAGRARLRRVEIGQRGGLEAQVLSGLEAAERVVVYPSDQVAAGARLAVRG